MDSGNKTIVKALYKLYEQGKNETEAFKEMSKTHSSYSISLKTVSNWFINFRSGEYNKGNKKKPGRKLKFTDEFLISLINENPELNMTELAKLANTATCTISKRLSKINANCERVNYINKKTKKSLKNISNDILN